MDQRIDAMAKVLARYSTKIKKGDEVYLVGEVDTLPLMRALYREAVDLEAHVHTLITDLDMKETLLRRGTDEQLLREPTLLRQVAEKADVMISLWGESNTKALSNVDVTRIGTRVNGTSAIKALFMEREGRNEIRWCGTQFPTSASAQDAAMSLSEYEDFVFGACLLDNGDPVAAWKEVGERQETLCKMLDAKKELHIVSKDTDLTMRVEGRKWINCNGLQNFPDGEVFTSPIEDSVEGTIRFSFPGISFGQEVENIRLVFKKGKVTDALYAGMTRLFR
ncbi:MAG: aminopeptidase, partial [Methanomassiliicoccales archaeon]|nr:aminopeptidase [Methanomassiliicoccales archaeon]